MTHYVYSGNVKSETISSALEAFKTYRAEREPYLMRVRDNEEFYRRSYSRTFGDIASTPDCDTPFIFAAIENCRADAIDNYPCANIIERDAKGTQIAQLLSKVVKTQLEISDFKSVYKENIRNKLKYGTAIYGVFYDDRAKGIDIRSVDISDVYVDMHIPDIQDSPYLFILSAVENEELRRLYPQFSELFTGNTQTQTLTGTHILKDRSAICDCYYKKSDGSVHLMKFCGETLLAATEDMEGYERGLYEHGKYPVVFDVLYPCENSPFGFGMIDIGKNTQTVINKLDNAIVENIMCAAKPRYLSKRGGGICEEEFCDISRSIVHYEGDTETLRAIDHSTINEYFLTHRERKKEELKEILANRDFQQGGTSGGVTAASAIETLRQAGEKRSRAIINDSYDSFRAVVCMVIELMREFYTEERTYRVTDSEGQRKFEPFSGEMMYTKDRRKLLFDIDVTIQRENPLTRESVNNTLLSLWSKGLISRENYDEAVITLKNMQFDGREKLISDLQSLCEKGDGEYDKKDF